MAGIQKGCSQHVYADTNAAPTTEVNFLNSVDVTLDGKLVDTTVLSASGCAAYVDQKQSIKDCKISLKGFLDKADAGQAALWSEFASGAGTLRCKVTLDGATTYYVNMAATVDNIAVSIGPEKMVEVTYSLANVGATTLDA